MVRTTVLDTKATGTMRSSATTEQAIEEGKG